MTHMLKLEYHKLDKILKKTRAKLKKAQPLEKPRLNKKINSIINKMLLIKKELKKIEDQKPKSKPIVINSIDSALSFPRLTNVSRPDLEFFCTHDGTLPNMNKYLSMLKLTDTNTISGSEE